MTCIDSDKDSGGAIHKEEKCFLSVGDIMAAEHRCGKEGDGDAERRELVQEDGTVNGKDHNAVSVSDEEDPIKRRRIRDLTHCGG